MSTDQDTDQITLRVAAQLRILANEARGIAADTANPMAPWGADYAADLMEQRAAELERESSTVAIITEWRVAFPSGEIRYYEDNQFPDDHESGDPQCREAILLSDWRSWDEEI